MEHFTEEELDQYVALASRIHDVARVVDPITCKCESGDIFCFQVWGKQSSCENCVSVHAVKTGEKTTKFEFMPNKDIYYVVSTPVERENGKVVAVETVNKINDNALIGAYGHSEFAEQIIRYNEMLSHDSGTGLYNKGYLQEQLDKLKEEPDRQVTAVMCDVDSFKNINDKQGHMVGDEILSDIGKVLKDSLEEGVNGFAARFGGDEFVLLIYGKEKEYIEKLVNHIKKDVDDLKSHYQNKFDISLSIGTASTQEGIPVEELLHKADENMYQDKMAYHREHDEPEK